MKTSHVPPSEYALYIIQTVENRSFKRRKLGPSAQFELSQLPLIFNKHFTSAQRTVVSAFQSAQSLAEFAQIGGPGVSAMPRYFFTIRWPEHQEIDEHGTQLKDDAAALNHACRLVRELRARGYDNPALVLHVSCESRQMVLSIPFLAACA